MSGTGGERRILAIVGATATGKTDLAESLAEAIGGEVVCADSRQVFRDLDVGTGKPDPATRAARPHHLFEALGLEDAASAGWYAGAAGAACAAIHGRGRIPVLVGGSGLYLAAAREGLAPTPPADPAVRARLADAWRAQGTPALHARLAQGDPETASRLAPNDSQRVRRALEVLEATGRPLSWWHRQPARGAIAGDWRVLELRVAPAPLAARIERRARWMFEHGITTEAESIERRGLGAALEALRAVGYDEALALLRGTLTREQAIARTGLRTRQLAKRQRTWFRHQPAGAQLEAGDDAGPRLADARRMLGI